MRLRKGSIVIALTVVMTLCLGVGLGPFALAMDCTKSAFDALNLTDVEFGLPVLIDDSLTGIVSTPTPNCRVRGTLWPEIKFEVRLPLSTWNGKFYQAGGGGFNGSIPNLTTPLSLNYAAAGTDSGHTTAEPGSIFAYDGPTHVNPNAEQKKIDFAYRSYYETAVVAKKVINAYYGSDPSYSYWVGCSEGGREALLMAQRFPELFNGIVSGSSIADMNAQWFVVYYLQAQSGPGAITAAKVALIRDAIYAKCDGIDGLGDGIINDPRECPFDPAVDLLSCPGDIDGPGCFTPAQIAAIKRFYTEAKNSAGQPLFPGFAWGATLQRPPGTGNGLSFIRYMAFNPPAGPSWDTPMFNIDTDPPRMAAVMDLLNATDPNLAPFKQRGGKLIHYHGWADQLVTPYISLDYYESVLGLMGLKGTKDFYNLYMVPGMGHCSGGVTGNYSTVDWFTPLVDWVENGTPPGTLTGSGRDASLNPRTRPVCAYPEFVRYNGTGDINAASSFTCVVPAAVRIEPEALNLKSKGVFSAFITLPEDYAGGDWQILSMTCAGVPAVQTGLSHQGGTFTAKFDRQDLGNVLPGDTVPLTVTAVAEREGKQVTFEGADTVKIFK